MIGNDWDQVLSVIENSDGFKKFLNIINEKYEKTTVFPSKNNVFNAHFFAVFTKFWSKKYPKLVLRVCPKSRECYIR